MTISPLLSVQADNPGDAPCAAENTDGDSVACQTISNPGYLTHKSFFAIGFGAGLALFDASGFAAGPTEVYVWAELASPLFACPATVLGSPCGFDMLVCNDRDLDTVCTNVGSSTDELYITQSNEAILKPDCSDTDKDDKDCADPSDAVVDACMTPAAQPPASADWNANQIAVFIGTWVDSWPGPPLNVGAGVSLGPYNVWVEDRGAC